MARPNVDFHLSELNSRLDDSLRLANDASGFHEMRTGRLRRIRSTRIYQINEMAFLGMFLAWEEFLEATFIRYMCGAVTKTNYKPTLYVTPRTLDHALTFFLVKPRDYVEWSSGQQVIERAEMVFRDGEPYRTALRSSLIDLNDMRIIRNAIAHRSGIAWTKFETAVRRILGSRPRGLSPGRFLRQHNTAASMTYIEYYKDVVSVAASRIVK